jgi:hypothetical protein
MASICNRCRRGVPEFVGWHMDEKCKDAIQVYRCTFCGNELQRPVSPHQIDIDDPRVANAALFNRFWEKRRGLQED